MEVEVTIDLEAVIDRARVALVNDHGISKGVAADIAALASVTMGLLHDSGWGEEDDWCLYLIDTLEYSIKKFREHAKKYD